MRSALIIEDDPDASEILAELLRDDGFVATQAFTGNEGLQAVRQNRPDMIFLDLMLPDIDGYKICETLKLERGTNPIPIVMVSALSADESRIRGFRVGADAYVSKPYTPEDIRRAIADADGHQQHLRAGAVEHFLKIDLSSEVSNLQSVNELFGILLKQARLNEREVVHLRTALQEMGHNAIEWGNRHDPSKRVTITCHVCTDRVEILIADEGQGFDPGNLPHAADGGDDPTRHILVREKLGLREGGFGILIAKGLLDEVTYHGVGNSVTLIKRYTLPEFDI